MAEPRIATPDGIGADQKIIGVIGVAPWSTLDFCKSLYAQISATKDWHYPRVIVDVNTKIPSRGRHFELGEEDFSSHLRDGIDALASAGAHVVVVTCNTAHIYYDRWGTGHAIDVPHIGRECVRAMLRTGARKVAICGGLSLRKYNLYEGLLADAGLESVPLDDFEAHQVAAYIEEVKQQGAASRQIQEQVIRVLRSLSQRGADGLILGCTELLSLQAAAGEIIPHVVESNTELARAALRIAAPSMAQVQQVESSR